MNRPLRIVAVCTHNRARSVAMIAHLQVALADRRVKAQLVGAGIKKSGLPPTKQIQAALAAQGLDVSSYRSHRINRNTALGADLIVTAERLHVFHLCELDETLFTRTFTLPELVARAEAAGPRHSQPIEQWLQKVGDGRSPATWFTAPIAEIADPSGHPVDVAEATVAQIADLCGRLVALL